MAEFSTHTPPAVIVHLIFCGVGIIESHTFKHRAGGADAGFEMQVGNGNIVSGLADFTQ